MKTGLILAAIAGLAYYKYSQMSEEQRRDMVNKVKEKGKKFYDKYVSNVKEIIPEKA
ncbi:MAG TPA: hypothetical protein VH396_04455 [Chitinophagaceae bacterium]|jgi:hypothetical protein